MIPCQQVAVDPPFKCYARGPDGQLIELTSETITPVDDRQRAHETRQFVGKALLSRARHDARHAATAAQREQAHRHVVAANRILLYVVASRPAARTAARSPRTAARSPRTSARRSTSSSSSTSDDGGEPPPPPLPAELRRIKQVAEHLHTPKSTVHSWVTSGLLSHYKINGIVLIDLADLARFLARHRVEGRP